MRLHCRLTYPDKTQRTQPLMQWIDGVTNQEVMLQMEGVQVALE